MKWFIILTIHNSTSLNNEQVHGCRQRAVAIVNSLDSKNVTNLIPSEYFDTSLLNLIVNPGSSGVNQII